MIRRADQLLKDKWQQRFQNLPGEAKVALHSALNELHLDAAEKSKHCWKKHKAPMALYWKVVSVYSGHLKRAIKIKP